ncbi:MAG: Pyrroline-5-carboxylate reductase [Chlamydiae bacterium]|nr:Pyrroline-5-carboxylate reductase [Chlamydiota bacterium]
MKIGIIGCGVMGGAMARTIAVHHELLLFDHKRSNSDPLGREIGAKVCSSFAELAKESEVVILAVKPIHVESVADDLDPLLDKETLLLSILGGTALKTLRELFSKPTIFRLMPNLPLLCGKGVIGVVDDEGDSDEDKARVLACLKGLGSVSWLKESLMNGFAALTGSNPAFIYLIIEAMVEAGITMGFKADQAQELLLETIEGSIALLRHSKSSLAELRWQIASPGGTTIAGLNELEAHKVRHGITRGIVRTYERAEEMEE